MDEVGQNCKEAVLAGKIRGWEVSVLRWMDREYRLRDAATFRRRMEELRNSVKARYAQELSKATFIRRLLIHYLISCEWNAELNKEVAWISLPRRRTNSGYVFILMFLFWLAGFVFISLGEGLVWFFGLVLAIISILSYFYVAYFSAESRIFAREMREERRLNLEAETAAHRTDADDIKAEDVSPPTRSSAD